MTELLLKLNCRFTNEDKEKCEPVIYKILELANLARTRGILALEIEVKQEPSIFLKTAIGMVVDGTDPVLVKQVLQNLILADEYSGSQLLERLLMAEGVLAVQRGENPQIISLKLSAMLGENYISPIREKFLEDTGKTTKFYSALRTLNDRTALPESAEFEAVFLRMDDRSIQTVLHDIDFSCLLHALHGCGGSLIQKILQNLSMNTGLQICGDLENNKSLRKESVLECQELIMKKIAALKNSGEIILSARDYQGNNS